MVQLHILSGKQAGAIFDCRKLPVNIGRSSDSHIRLEDEGVWPSHCWIRWLQEGIVMEVESDAMASLNGTTTPRAILRNGDTLTLGGVSVRFSLSPVRQSSLALREWLTWFGLGGLCLFELAVVYWLVQ